VGTLDVCYCPHIVFSRRNESIIEYSSVQEKAISLGIGTEDRHEVGLSLFFLKHTHAIKINQIRESLQFLHELGSMQYFDNEFLRDQVVVNPQWLVDVMACMISVKENVIVVGCKGT
jgi:hypothetical protein